MPDSVARRRRRKTKIVATLGPSSSTRDQIAALHQAGVDVFRLNFSHGTHEDHAARVTAIRSIEEETGRPIAILADLQGPKLRIGTFESGSVALQAGQSFRLDMNPAPGDATRVHLPHQELINAITPGSDVLLDDGRVRLRVTAQHADALDTVVVAGAQLSNRKGVNVPEIVLPLSALTDKDRRDLTAALEFGVDWVALSFVQRPDDVAEARRLIEGRAAVMVKLEKPQALDHLDQLIEMSDGVMVARGDLGVEMPAEEVPVLQRKIFAAVRRAGKPVIVATQMLESMISAPTPSRA
ncbi:MAG: pyruvate kinase [Rhodospirillales bacterium]|nr:pyruvate kinase [Rhodospirillales bacterium]